MKCTNCDTGELVQVPIEFPGDYSLQCNKCGIYLADWEWDGTTASDFLDA